MILVRVKPTPNPSESYMGEVVGILLLATACLIVAALQWFGVIQ